MTTVTLPVLPTDIHASIEDHVFAHTDHEVGGILVGSLTDGVVTVEAAIPALRATEGSMNVTFTHEVWADVLDIVERDHPGLRIIGWYHSHPGFGIFLSEYDSFIQTNFFGEPGMLALVVDPLAGELGWFTSESGAVRELGRDSTVRAAVRRTVDVVDERRARRGTALRAVGAGLVIAGLAGLGGYALGSLSTDPVTGAVAGAAGSDAVDVARLQADLAAAEARVSELEAAAGTGAGTDTSAGTVSIRYTVRAGDSWWSIAQRLTGSGAGYPTLQEANPDTVLHPGTVVVVPGVPASGDGAS